MVDYIDNLEPSSCYTYLKVLIATHNVCQMVYFVALYFFLQILFPNTHLIELFFAIVNYSFTWLPRKLPNFVFKRNAATSFSGCPHGRCFTCSFASGILAATCMENQRESEMIRFYVNRTLYYVSTNSFFSFFPFFLAWHLGHPCVMTLPTQVSDVQSLYLLCINPSCPQRQLNKISK